MPHIDLLTTKEHIPITNEIHRRSLFGEILDWILAPLLIIWPISIGISYAVVKNIADKPFDRALEEHIAQLSSATSLKNQSIEVAKPLTSFFHATGVPHQYYAVRGEDMRFIAGDPHLPFTFILPSLPPNTVEFSNIDYQGTSVRLAYSSINLATEKFDTRAYLLVGETLERRTQLTGDIIKGVILPQLLVLPLILVFVWFALTRGLLPLRKIQTAISKRSPQDLAPIDTSEIPEEIAPLVTSMNGLLHQLNQMLASQKNFIANAAHQMKTPLAGLRTQAELALRLTHPQEINRSLSLISIAAEQSTRLINQLLLLARSENLNDADCQPCDLIEIGQQATQQWIEAALAKQIDLGFECEAKAVWVRGLPLMLTEVLHNLIDNAIRYNPAGSIITVRLHTRDMHAVLSVEDNGVGMTEFERAHIFDRFYRVSQSTEGSGLGLAIVREIVHFHGGEIAVLARLSTAHTTSISTGTIFQITLPLL